MGDVVDREFLFGFENDTVVKYNNGKTQNMMQSRLSDQKPQGDFILLQLWSLLRDLNTRLLLIGAWNKIASTVWWHHHNGQVHQRWCLIVRLCHKIHRRSIGLMCYVSCKAKFGSDTPKEIHMVILAWIETRMCFAECHCENWKRKRITRKRVMNAWVARKDLRHEVLSNRKGKWSTITAQNMNCNMRLTLNQG